MLRTILTLVCVFAAGVADAGAQILYKVEGNGLKSPSYIFGTHHLAPLSVLDSIVPQTHDVFSEAVAVVGELDMSDSQATSLALVKYMQAPADSTLSSLYTPEEFERLDGEFRKWSGGLSLKLFDGMKPMVPNMTVALAMVMNDIPGFNPAEQLDTYFQTAGRQLGKRIIPLETAEEQGEFLFNSVSIAEQAKALAEQLDNPQKAVDDARMLNACYFAQDIEALLRQSAQESENPEFFEKLLYRRNAAWLEKLPTLLEEGPLFIAVGALHLAGDRGVVNGLRRLGYTVSPL